MGTIKTNILKTNNVIKFYLETSACRKILRPVLSLLKRETSGAKDTLSCGVANSPVRLSKFEGK